MRLDNHFVLVYAYKYIAEKLGEKHDFATSSNLIYHSWVELVLLTT